MCSRGYRKRELPSGVFYVAASLWVVPRVGRLAASNKVCRELLQRRRRALRLCRLGRPPTPGGCCACGRARRRRRATATHRQPPASLAANLVGHAAAAAAPACRGQRQLRPLLLL